MKAVDINKGSWHFWLASQVSWKQTYYSNKLCKRVPTDFCYYVRRVILGFIWVAILASVALALAGLYLYSGYYTVQWVLDMIHQGKFFQGPGEAGPFLFITSMTLAVGIALGVILCIAQALKWRDTRCYLARELARSRAEPTLLLKEPSFVQVAYRSIKDKVCFRINIVE
jgi:hypothetical protein